MRANCRDNVGVLLSFWSGILLKVDVNVVNYVFDGCTVELVQELLTEGCVLKDAHVCGMID